MDSLKGMYNIAFVKLFISLLFTILLNHLCQRGLGIISWIIVFIPFMLMSLVSALLIVMLGMDVKTGKLNIPEEKEEPTKEEDAREKAIANYGMNRTKDDYMKIMKKLGYLNLSSKAGEKVINPAYDESYYTQDSREEYELVKSGSGTNKMKTQILAEEIYFLLKNKISNNEIRLEKDLGGKVRNMMIEQCDSAIDILYQDLHYRLSKIYGVYDMEDSKHEDGIRKALEEISTWGVLRDLEGRTVLSDEMNMESVRDYTDMMVNSDPEWINKVMSSYKRKMSSRYESRCEKIQVKIDNYAAQRNIDFGDIINYAGNSGYNSAYNDAYTSAVAGVGELWSRRPTQQQNRQYIDLPKTAETTTGRCTGGAASNILPSAPCVNGNCYGVGERCGTNEVCGSGCCYNNKCMYYEANSLTCGGQPCSGSNWADPSVVGRTSADAMTNEVARRTGGGEVGQQLCQRKVTADRSDAGGGWGLDLSFKCGDTEVSIGPSPENNSKTSADSYNLSSNACPTRVDKSNWSGRHPSTGDQYNDKFDITVSDCISSTAATAAPFVPAPKQKIIIKFKTGTIRWDQSNDPFHVEFYKGDKTTKIGEKQKLFDSIGVDTEIEKEFELDGVGPNDKIWVKVLTDSNDGLTLKKFTTIYNNQTIEYTNIDSTAGGAPDNTVGNMDKNQKTIPIRWFTKINE